MALLDSGCTIYIPNYSTNTNKLKLKNPVIIVGVKATVTTDAVKYGIPLLLSEEAIKKAKTQIDFQEDKINIFGKRS